MNKKRSAEIDAKVLAYCQKQRHQITAHRVSVAAYGDASWQSAARYRLEKLTKQGVLKKIFAGSGTDPAIYEIAEEEPAPKLIRQGLTDYGFLFGAAEVSRLFSRQELGSVAIAVRTTKQEIRIYVTRTGLIRVFDKASRKLTPEAK